ACQYAPPHEFGIDVPRTLSKVRVESYEAAAWPDFGAVAFRKPWTTRIAALATSVLVFVGVGRPFAGRQITPADFYAVMPHRTMVALFGVVGLFVVLALAMGHRRFAAMAGREGPPYTVKKSAILPAGRDALTLKHLHATGE